MKIFLTSMVLILLLSACGNIATPSATPESTASVSYTPATPSSTATPIVPSETATAQMTRAQEPVGWVDPTHPEAGARPVDATSFDTDLDRWTKTDANGITMYALNELGPNHWEYLANNKTDTLMGGANAAGNISVMPIHIFTDTPHQITVAGPDYNAQFPGSSPIDALGASYPTKLADKLVEASTGKTYLQLKWNDVVQFVKDIQDWTKNPARTGPVALPLGSDSWILSHGVNFVITDRSMSQTDASFHHVKYNDNYGNFDWKYVVNNHTVTIQIGIDDLLIVDPSMFAHRVFVTLGETIYDPTVATTMNAFDSKADSFCQVAGTNWSQKLQDGSVVKPTIPFVRIVK